MAELIARAPYGGALPLTLGTVTLSADAAAAEVSPDWVRISTASALALQMRSGRFNRTFDNGGINLLLN